MRTTPARLLVAVVATSTALLCQVPSSIAAPDTTPPKPVKAVRSAATDSAVRLTWTNPGAKDLAGVVVRRSVGLVAPTSPTSGTLVRKLKKTRSAVTDRGLQADTTYSYALFAFDTRHNFARRAIKSVETAADTTTPAAVSLLLTTTTESTATLAWSNPADSDFDGVEIRRAAGDAAPGPEQGQPVARLAGPAGRFTDTGLDAGTTYSYSIFSLDRAGNRGPAESATVTTDPDTTPPGPIAGLGRTATETTVHLTWTNPPARDFSGVVIRRAVGNDAPDENDGVALDGVVAPGHQRIDDGLDPRTVYSYSLWAVDGRGNQSARTTTTVSTRPDITAPGPVIGLAAESTESSVSLTWTNPDDVDLADVVVRRSSGATAPATPASGFAVPLTTPKATSVIDRGLDHATTYSYAVFSRDMAGNVSVASSATTDTKKDTTRPAAPTDFVATPGEEVMALSWTNPDDADVDHLIVVKALGTSAPPSPEQGTPVAELDAADDHVTDTGLVPQTKYAYSIFAVDINGNLSGRATVTESTLPDRTRPDAVSDVDGTSTDHAVALSWTKPTDADFSHVVIRRSEGVKPPASITAGEPAAKVDSPAAAFTDVRLHSQRLYSYALFAVDTSGNVSSRVTFAALTEQDITPPGPITDAVFSATDSTITLNWTNPVDLDFTGLVVRRATGGAAQAPATVEHGVGVAVEATATEVTDRGLDFSTDYVYSVFAKDGDGHVTRAVITARTLPDATAPGPVTQLSAAPTDSTVKLTWVNPTAKDFKGVTVVRNQGPDAPTSVFDGTVVATLPKGAQSTTDNGLAASTTYNYAVFSYDNSNLSSRATVQIATDSDRTPPSPVAINSVDREDHRLVLRLGPAGEPVEIIVTRAQGTVPPTNPAQGIELYSGTPVDHVVDAGLASGTDFAYTVFTFDQFQNQSADSETTSTLPDTTNPGPVTDVRASADDHEVLLEWAYPDDTDLAGATIVRKLGNAEPTSPADGDAVFEVTTASHSFEDTDLEANQQYSYSVFARDGDDRLSAATPVRIATEHDVTPPGPVLDPTIGLSGPTAVSLRWSLPVDLDFDRLVIRRTADAAPATSPTDGEPVGPGVFTDNSPRSFDDAGLLSGADYQYSFFTFDEDDNWSEPVVLQVTTPPDNVPPGRIGSLDTGRDAETGRWVWSWTNPPDPDLAAIVIRRNTGFAAPRDVNDGESVAVIDLVANPEAASFLEHTWVPRQPYTYSFFVVDRSGNTSLPISVPVVFPT